MEFPEGRGVYSGSRFWQIQRGGGVIGKIPSVGGYGYFLELHNPDKIPMNVRITDPYDRHTIDTTWDQRDTTLITSHQ